MKNNYEYKAPAFLQGQSAAEIHSRMLAALPADIDTSEGQFIWDFTMPTALEKAEMIEFQLNEAIKEMFPFYASGHWLDLHGANRGITRKEALPAYGQVLVKGTVGTVIPAKTSLFTSGTAEKAAIEFITDTEAVIGETGSVLIPVTAVVPGLSGNVAAETILLTGNIIAGIAEVSNPEATQGGVEEEDDEALRARIVTYDQNQGVSFVGSLADYKRWALEVDGVGAVTVIPPTNASGKIQLLLVDSKGDIADATLCTAVNQHIMSPDKPEQRLAPINALLEVKAPTALTVNINSTIVVDSTTTVTAVKTAFTNCLKEIYPEAVAAGSLKYSQVANLLLQIPGVLDYSNLKINNGTINLTISANQYPVTGQVVFNV